VNFVHSNWFAQLQGKFDLIVANPPYIAEGDPHLPALNAEPRMALVSGLDGLDAIRHIIKEAPKHLHPGAWLLLEHGFDQAPAVRDLLMQRGFGQVQSRVDLAGIKRCSGGCWPEVK
jgi:release factor glutamine methyltransferase